MLEPNALSSINDAQSSKWYSAQGVRLMLPDGYVCDVQPEWRLAHFAVVLPIPEIPAGFNWPQRWVPGRFRGIKTVEAAGNIPSQPGYRSRMQNGMNDYAFAPRVFHKGAISYFREPLASSVGAAALDASVKADAGAGEWSSMRSSNPCSVLARRFMFEADLTEEYGNFSTRIPTRPTLFKLMDDDAHPFSTLRLLSAEILRYSGPHLYSLGDSEPQPLTQSFLIVHVAAENCSGAVLEQVNSSLTKTREKIRLSAHGGSQQRRRSSTSAKSHVSSVPAEVNLLEVVVGAVEDELFGDSSPWALEKGGFIRASNRSRSNGQSTKPYCVTMAIPGTDRISRPSPLQFDDEDDESAQLDWSPHDTWAWYLAARFDRYISDIPDFASDSSHGSLVARYRDWTIHSCEEGLALVRRKPLENAQNSFIMLAGTRFVDLALLTRRSKNYLSRIGEQLRQLSFGPAALNVLDQPDPERHRPSSLEEMKDADRKLQQSLRNFAKIQAEFVYLRDHLWYERVPGREVATTILQHMLEKTGARRDFEDIADELELRKNVYSTQYNFARIRLDGIEADHMKKKQELRDERNIFLALSASILAIPGLFALLPNAESWTVFFTCTAIVMGLAFWAYCRHLRKEKELNGASREIFRRTNRVGKKR